MKDRPFTGLFPAWIRDLMILAGWALTLLVLWDYLTK